MLSTAPHNLWQNPKYATSGAHTRLLYPRTQEEEAYGQQLEQQISVLRGASGTLEATTRQQAESQGPVYFTLTAQAGAQQALGPAARRARRPPWGWGLASLACGMWNSTFQQGCSLASRRSVLVGLLPLSALHQPAVPETSTGLLCLVALSRPTAQLCSQRT